MPDRIESAPSVGPTVFFSRYVSDAGSAPDRSTSERSCTSCCVKVPRKCGPSSVIRPSMTGADCTRPSRMIARRRPMFSPVALPNFRAPSWLSEKLTAGRLFSSSVGLALRRSRPVTTGTLRTR